jgi:penicillin amidase
MAAVAALCALLLLAAVIAAALSLPATDGTRSMTGLQASVDIARDAQGVPTISGTSREDIAYATGFVHAQERFFQMDLLRRSAAGTLAALLGPSLLDVDRARRIYGFDRLAAKAYSTLPPTDKRILERYTAGVNAGLSALRVRPFEYLLLRTQPTPWRAQDSMLVVWSMYFELQSGELHRDFARGWLREHTADLEALKTLLPDCSEWELPGDGNMPRVAAPSFGQSERMVVSPGHEPLGIFNMPGGESGHPMSSYFLAGHEAWVHGQRTALLPGARAHTLRLIPAR